MDSLRRQRLAAYRRIGSAMPHKKHHRCNLCGKDFGTGDELEDHGLSDTGQAARTPDGAGRNSSETQRLFKEGRAALGSYTREFTQANKEAVGLEPSCNCSTDETEAGIVIDPFVGSGTTCSVAKQLQRRWAGIELNEESAALAESNLGITVSDPDQLIEESQQTFHDYI